MKLEYISKYSLCFLAALGLVSCSDEVTPGRQEGNELVMKARLAQGNDSGWKAGSKVAVRAQGQTLTYTLGADGSMERRRPTPDVAGRELPYLGLDPR